MNTEPKISPLLRAITLVKEESKKESPDWNGLILMLESLLGVEKEFAREVFKAGQDYMVDVIASGKLSTPPIKPDFSQFIEQYNKKV